MGYSPWGCKESDTTEVNKHTYISPLTRVNVFRTFLQTEYLCPPNSWVETPTLSVIVFGEETSMKVIK